MTLYLLLFWEFFKTGLFAMGGGLATLPFLYEISDKTKWFSTDDILNMIAVSESTPGPLGVNMATFAGILAGNISGGLVATLGLILPSVITIILIAKILNQYKNAKLIQAIFNGIRPASIAMIAVAGLVVAKSTFLYATTLETTCNILSLINIPFLFLGILFWIGIHKWKASPILYILIAAIIGVVFQL